MDNREAKQIWEGLRGKKISKEEEAVRRKKEENKVDELAGVWYYLDPVTDSARKRALRMEIINRLLLLFDLTKAEREQYEYNPAYDNGLLDFFCNALDNFNPDKGSICHYISEYRKKRLAGVYKREVDKLNIVSGADSANKNGKKRDVVRVDNVRYDTESGRQESVFDSVTDSHGDMEPLLDKLAIMEAYDGFTHKILKFMMGIKPNKTEVKWYRIFYTEGLTDLVNINSKDYVEGDFKHERDVLEVINSEYLNFYMKNHCDTIRDIRYSPLKLYDEIMEGIDEEKATRMIDFPLIKNPDVSIAYYDVVYNKKESKQTRSNYLNIYKKNYLDYCMKLIRGALDADKI